MSGIRPQQLTEFYRSLRARNLTTDSLAKELGVSGPKIRKLIVCLQPRRGLAWTGLLKLLTDRERQLLLDVEQCSAWNIRQRAKRPTWNVQKVVDLAEAYRAFEPAKEQICAPAWRD